MGYIMKFTKIALATAMTVAASAASAETFFYDNSLTALYGQSYESTFGSDTDNVVLTFEHFSAHSWGDVFAFGDRVMEVEQDGTSTYIEVAPRFKVSGFDAGIVKNVYLATQWEMSEFDDNFLVGLGTDFNIRGFQNLSFNAYQRLNDDGDNNYQTTTVWGVPFAIAGQNFKFDGFWDWATGTANGKAATSNFTYQLKWDAAPTLGMTNKVYVGIEHAIWDNKYQNDSFNENVVNAIVKVHF
jgi:nucleoside-specific outer membrane channel protein Tsx